MDIVTCLESLVGLTDKQCDCLQSGWPNYGDAGTETKQWMQSKTGRFITDPENGFPLIESVYMSQNCGDVDLLGMLTKSRKMAALDIIADMATGAGGNRKTVVPAFDGFIGQPQTRTSVVRQQARSATGLVLSPRQPAAGATLTIHEFRTTLRGTGDATIVVESSDPDVATVFVPFTLSDSDAWTTVIPDNPIELPMYSPSSGGEIRYVVFAMTPAGTTHTGQNVFACCGSRPTWMESVTVGGFNTDDDPTNFLDLSRSFSTAKQGYGWSIRATIECTMASMVCDWGNVPDELRDAIGRAMQHRAAAKLVSYVIESGRINRFTLLKLESLFGKRASLNRMYNDDIARIRNFDGIDPSGCTVCKPKHGMRTATIFS